MAGVKRYETRSWTPGSETGPLLIHAGRHQPTAAEISMCEMVSDDLALPRGVLLGVVNVVAFHRAKKIRDGLTDVELLLGDWPDGGWAWEVVVVERFISPVPARGRQGLWHHL